MEKKNIPFAPSGNIKCNQRKINQLLLFNNKVNENEFSYMIAFFTCGKSRDANSALQGVRGTPEKHRRAANTEWVVRLEPPFHNACPCTTPTHLQIINIFHNILNIWASRHNKNTMSPIFKKQMHGWIYEFMIKATLSMVGYCFVVLGYNVVFLFLARW